MSKRLFIGGEHDGRRLDVPPLAYIQLPCKPDISLDYTIPAHRSPRRVETYRREALGADDEVFHVYVYETLQTKDALYMLISNYKPEKP